MSNFAQLDTLAREGKVIIKHYFRRYRARTTDMPDDQWYRITKNDFLALKEVGAKVEKE